MEKIKKKIDDYKEGSGQLYDIDDLINQARLDEEFINTQSSNSIFDILKQSSKMKSFILRGEKYFNSQMEDFNS